MKARYRILRIRGCGRVAVKNTSGLPDAEVVAMVRHALRDVNCGDSCVHVKKMGYGAHSGMAYYYMPMGFARDVEVPRWARSLIMAKFGGSVSGLVDTLAHEAKHIEEYREGRYRRNKETRQTEAKARAFGGKRASDWVKQTAPVKEPSA